MNKEIGKQKKNSPTKDASTSRVESPKITVGKSGNCLFKYDNESGAFGTKDADLVSATVEQLGQIFSHGENLANSDRCLSIINAAFASIVELEPKDSTELMLATQMVTVHNMAMELSRRAMLNEQTVDGVERNINRANKLMRTFTTQIEALNKYRTKGKQKITVQHVNVNDGGQAIVGDVKGGG